MRPACSPTARRLLEAAADLFLSAGIEETRVHDIAARAGFTTGTVYASFEGKAALLAAVLAECGDDMVVPLLELLGAEGPAVDVLMSLAHGGGTASAQAALRLLADSCAAASRDDSVRRALLPLLERIEALLRARVAHGRAWGLVGGQSPTGDLARCGLTLLLGAGALRSAGFERSGAWRP